MSIYAEVTINLKDGRQVGTSDITQGSIRDAVLDLMEQCIPTEVPCTSIILSEESLVLQEMATVFQKNVDFKFDATVCDNYGEPGTITVNSNSFEEFKNDVLNDRLILTEIDQDEYSSAFLPSWTAPIYDTNFNEKRNVAIFLCYCELFLNSKILFGVQTKDIASIELVLS